MRITIQPKKFKFVIPAPLIFGSLAIKCIPRDKITKEEKEIALKLYKELKKTLKKYKGLEIINIEGENGSKLSIRI